MDLISVIVPVYNVEGYIDKCIKSLINQTYHNIEIILVDDGSTDNSPGICDSWASNDSRIKVIHIPNGGVSHARNVGLDAAIGDYVGFVDSDDWVEPDMYEKMLKVIHEDDSDICGGGYVKDFENTQEIILKIGEPCYFSNIETMKWMFSEHRPKLLFWEVCDKIFKKKLVTNIRFKENITMCEDMLFTWNVLKNAKKISYRPLHKYHYMMRGDSACHTQNFKHRIDSAIANMKLYNDPWLNDAELKELVHERYCNGIITKMRLQLLYPEKFNCDINDELKEHSIYLRKNFTKIFLSPNRTLRSRLGLILLCFPLWLSRKILPIVVKG